MSRPGENNSKENAADRDTGMRLDKLLVKHGYARSREDAREKITNGLVSVNGHRVNKPSVLCNSSDKPEVLGDKQPPVSRAALKLEYALKLWPIMTQGAVCWDVGASTGGFTQVLLEHGARQVFALDVGRGQLAPELINDPRVISLEGRNVREACFEWFGCYFDLIVIDVSFISLGYVLPRAVEMLKTYGEIVALVKPQFEVGKDHIGRGVVRDEGLQTQVLEKIKLIAYDLGLNIKGEAESPISGGKGNKEFLLYLVPDS